MSDETDIDELVAQYFHDVGDASVRPPEWVIQGCIPVGITFLVGPPKTLKSTVLMAWATRVAGWHTDKVLPAEMLAANEDGIVFGVSAEASAGEIRHAVEVGMKIEARADRSLLVADDPWMWRLDNPAHVGKLVAILNRLKPKLFFLDPLANFHDQDETEAGTMIRLLTPLRHWAKENGAACVVVHHSRKNAKDGKDARTTADDIRGSGAIFGMADGLVLLTRKKSGDLIVEGIYKRGERWERTIDPGAWTEERRATPSPTVVSENARKAAALIAEGKTWAQVQESMKVGAGTLARWLKAVEIADKAKGGSDE